MASTAYQRSYYEKNKELIHAKNKAYYEANKDKIMTYNEANKKRRSEYYKLYNLIHKEEKLAYDIEYRKVTVEKRKARTKEYYINNKQKIIDNVNQYNRKNRQTKLKRDREYLKTLDGKLNARKHNAKRKQELEYNPINTYFEGSQGHHIDMKYVIYIPSSIHKQIPHTQRNNKSMIRINIIAWDYLEANSY